MIEILLAACATLFIYDGDNVRCNGVTYRMANENAPEIRGKCEFERDLAKKSRDRLREIAAMPGATLEEVLCYGSNFGRKCAIVRVNGTTAGDILIREGLAESYSCGSQGCPRRRNWCTPPWE